MLVLIPNSELSASDIKILRELTGEPISAIKKASTEQTPLKRYMFFGNDWQETRLELKKLVYDWREGSPPFSLKEEEASGLTDITLDDLYAMLKHARSIELEQEMASDLEMGHIKTKKEFEPHEDDWI